MLPQILGFTLTRTIPTKVLLPVLTGAYQVCGGVIRNNSGQIMAHLINKGNPIGALQPISAAGGMALSGFNTFQIHQTGKTLANLGQGINNLNSKVDALGGEVEILQNLTNHLVLLSNGTMALSGLTLAVSTAGFAFLNRKLNKIDEKLQELQKDVKEIKDFLNMQQRAELATALQAISNLNHTPNEEVRRQVLVQTNKDISVLNHFYRLQFKNAASAGILDASEEYFTITAIAQALCQAELDLFEPAANSLQNSYAFWLDICQKISKEKFLRSNPERFLDYKLASAFRTDELIDWMDFANGETKGFNWIDELRPKYGKDSFYFFSRYEMTQEEHLEISILRKMVARNRIYQGYCSQFQYFKEQKIRPSTFQVQVDSLDSNQMVHDTYLLVANNLSA